MSTELDPLPPFHLNRNYIWRQVKINIVAIVSVLVALTGLLFLMAGLCLAQILVRRRAIRSRCIA